MARILVIDDEADVRTATRRILERSGHEVMEASSGEEGVESFNQNPADLIITDIVMPGQGGVETVALLREQNPGLRIIAMSAHALDELPEAAKFGAARTIVKPFTVDTLTKMVDEVLRGEEEPEEKENFEDVDELLIEDDIEWPEKDEEDSNS